MRRRPPGRRREARRTPAGDRRERQGRGATRGGPPSSRPACRRCPGTPRKERSGRRIEHRVARQLECARWRTRWCASPAGLGTTGIGSSAGSAAPRLRVRAHPAARRTPPTVKFCGECGTALAAAAQAPDEPAPSAASPAAERRLVSVLFADLVGFTAASEDRDAEETRELLSRYFEQARTLIERYGGTVEKFIGDAVMAVWGTPVAQEDDAERAVRAALDLVAAVPELDAAAAGPRRHPHGRGGRHARRRGPGDGCRRPRQHRLARAVGGRAGHGPRRRVDQARIGGGRRLRWRGRARAQGKGGAGPALARPPRRPPAAAAPSSPSASSRPSSGATASFGS